ncbi:MAG TPA: alpha/beta fold hydrolase [Solirubrobacterales bacterium]|nr:alpha/beta fold hydrolase [Solirubrobacterales bacterium]
MRVFYEVYGSGEPTILLCPTWTLVHSRVWKMQIPYLARHHRVVVFDPRGNGRSDRPPDVEAYAESEFARDALDVLDATGTEQAVVVGLSRGTQRALLLAAEHPERVLAAVLIGPWFPASRSLGGLRYRVMFHPWVRSMFTRRPITTRSWAKVNAVHFRRDFRDFVEWFAGMATSEAHSTKGFDDVVEWGLETDPDTLAMTVLADAAAPVTRRDQLALARRVRCPVLVISGKKDKVTSHADARALARATGGELVAIEGGDHLPEGRQPVAVNLAIREFADPLFRCKPSVKRSSGRRRALYVSSPIGLGHARRDVAIARELRALHPDLEIDWLAQDPVTRVLEAEGERIHPASRHLANESAHIESESAEHGLQCFQAIRRMDEILAANYMVFDDVVSETPYDLWIGDEAWELDYHLHENPGRKRAPFAWLTDFVGWLPMPENGEREASVAADYNAEMVEHIRDHPEVRDRAIFVGNPEDIVSDRLGPDLPGIREWTEQNFDFAGYVTGFDQAELGDRERLRAELGYQPHERVCLVTVGGSGVGASLLRRVMGAFPAAAKLVPELRMIVVAGPRIDPATLPAADGLEVRAYVDDLYRHLAACDLAVVQGGLTTAMELTAAQRPFLYFPLRHHFEQRFHVAHRLDRYRAGRRMDFEGATPDIIAQAIAEEIGRDVDYRPVETGGAHLAAQRIAELLN